MPRSRKAAASNEWEFQGVVVSHLNAILAKSTGLGLDKVTQEPRTKTGKRNDVVVWKDCSTRSAFLTLELKNPETAITDPAFFVDADAKARHWNASYFAIWNMKYAELYRVPVTGPTTSADLVSSWGPIEGVLIVSFPPARTGGIHEKVDLPVPHFDAIVGSFSNNEQQDVVPHV